MKNNNEYLYGTNDVPEIPKCIIDQRLYLIERNLTRVQDVPMKERDDVKKNYLINARDFWTDMRTNNGGY